jgi:hypothetical protein
VAHAGSATVFSRSSRSSTALAISSSSTTTSSSTYFSSIPKVFSPMRRTAIPSAIVSAGGMVTSSPASRARSAAGRADDSTPITRTRGATP